jgi:hypothetical protein
MRRFLLPALLLAGSAPALAQTTGAIAGQIRDSATGHAIDGARVVLDSTRASTVSNALGAYRLRELAPGWHRLTVRAIGYRGLNRDSVFVRTAQTTPLDFVLVASPIEIAPVAVSAPVDSVLDPLAVTDAQTFDREALRRLPVSSVDEAIGLSAGSVGESYRGGRLGQQAFILDGLGLKNQLDASTGSLGIRVPPDMLTEASLVTNGFSARYGQAVSALVNLVTRDGGDQWHGRTAYETDRPFGNGLDFGLDRAVVQADGPVVGGIKAAVALDASARLDFDPVNAPAPTDPLDPRTAKPWLLPHNSGEQGDLAGKLTIPLGLRQTLRLFGVRSVEQRQLYDPLYKYDASLAPVRRVTGTLLSGHLQRTFPRQNVVADLRVGYFTRQFIRGTAVDSTPYAFGAFTFKPAHIVGEDLARAQDTAGAAAAIPGFAPPQLSDRTPWGVPAFFQGSGSRGELAWNRFREIRTRLDVSIGAGPDVDVYVGGEIANQKVQTFQRTLGYLAVGEVLPPSLTVTPGTVPPATAANFTPVAAALYTEAQYRKDDLAFTAGLRYDRFTGRTDLPGVPHTHQQSISPRFAVSTVLRGATFVASYGRFRQPPDYQYLTDAAFDDTTRTGRFRRGNPDLGFEKSDQYEFSLRLRAAQATTVRINAYVRRLDGLVASVPLGVNPDSSIFGNSDAGSVKGGELIVERTLHHGWGARVSYNLQQATANSTNAFLLRNLITIDPVTHDTTFPAKVEFPLDYDRRHSITAIVTTQISPTGGPALLGIHPLGGIETAAIFRYSSGLPFSRTNAAGDSLIGPPNSSRLPSTQTVDMLLRRPIRIARLGGSVYLDMRNVFNRRNIVAVRRETGSTTLDNASIQALADRAYAAHPEAIPYESPRYRSYADLNHDGYVAGSELPALYLQAARDFAQPLFAYGQPRLARIGMEFVF